MAALSARAGDMTRQFRSMLLAQLRLQRPSARARNQHEARAVSGDTFQTSLPTCGMVLMVLLRVAPRV